MTGKEELISCETVESFMNIIFLGKPFSGKGTQSVLLSERLEIPVFSMGHILRKAHEQDSQGTQWWWEISLQGLNVPTTVKEPLFEKELRQANRGIILDNFPATMDDLEFLEKCLKKTGNKIDKVFFLKVSDETVQKRRQIARGREDDNPMIVAKRLEEEFGRDLQPVLDYFKKQGILAEIDGEKEIEEINQDIQAHLKTANQ